MIFGEFNDCNKYVQVSVFSHSFNFTGINLANNVTLECANKDTSNLESYWEAYVAALEQCGISYNCGVSQQFQLVATTDSEPPVVFVQYL